MKGCIVEREVDNRDFQVEDILGESTGTIPEEYSLKIIDAKNQGALKATQVACTCFSTYHAGEASRETLDSVQLNPRPVEGWELQKKFGTASKSGDLLKTAFKSVIQNGIKADKDVTVTGYAQVCFRPDTEKEVFSMKQRLSEGYALITTIDIWTNTSRGCREGELPKPEGVIVAGHAICIIGYNKKGFIALNSYGEKWGKFKNGTFIIPYERAALLYGVYLLYSNPTNMVKIFEDVYSTSLSAKEIEFVKSKGLMLGTDEGRFEPDRPITRREMAIILYRLNNLT